MLGYRRTGDSVDEEFVFAQEFSPLLDDPHQAVNRFVEGRPKELLLVETVAACDQWNMMMRSGIE